VLRRTKVAFTERCSSTRRRDYLVHVQAMPNPQSPSPEMDQVSLKIVDDIVDKAAAERAYTLLLDFPKIPHGLFCISLSSLRLTVSVEDLLPAYFGGELAAFILSYLRRLDAIMGAPVVGKKSDGAVEFWIMRIDSNKDDEQPSGDLVYVHADTHSGPKPISQTTPRPSLATILYLGQCHGSGGTYVCVTPALTPQMTAILSKHVSFTEALAASEEWIRIPRRSGRAVGFDGSMAHFIEPLRDLKSDRPRITLLANFWRHSLPFTGTLAEPSRLTVDEFRQFCDSSRPDMPASLPYTSGR
jgi:hypothetical protein